MWHLDYITSPNRLSRMRWCKMQYTEVMHVTFSNMYKQNLFSYTFSYGQNSTHARFQCKYHRRTKYGKLVKGKPSIFKQHLFCYIQTAFLKVIFMGWPILWMNWGSSLYNCCRKLRMCDSVVMKSWIMYYSTIE